MHPPARSVQRRFRPLPAIRDPRVTRSRMTEQNQPIAFRHVLYLLLSLAMVTAPHAFNLPWWIVALAATLFAWRAHLGHARHAVPNRWLVILVALGGLIGVFLTFRTIFGR